MTPRDVANRTGVTERTCWRIKARAEARSGDLSTKSGSGGKPQIDHRRLRDILWKRVQRNPERSIRDLARSMPEDLKVSEWTVQRELDKMGLKSYRGLVKHDIMPGQEARRLKRAQRLLQWRQDNQGKVILFTDEKWFYVQKAYHQQNTHFLLPARLRIWNPDNMKRIIRVRKSPAKVMVFGLMASDGKVMDPVFVPAEETINTQCYLTWIMPRVRE